MDLVLPDLFDHVGGIARISRATALACHQWSLSRGEPLVVHALRDGGSQRDRRYLPEPSIYRAYAGSKPRLAAGLLQSQLRQRGALALFGHVNLAVLGPLFTRRYALIAHGIEVWRPLSLSRRTALRRAGALWPISAYTADELLRRHDVAPRCVEVIPNCLDPAFPIADAPLLATDPPSFLVVTRLHPEALKGVDDTIRGFGRALGGLSDTTRLVIIGDGDDRPRLEALAAKIAPGRVDFLGRVSDAELQLAFASCLAFVLPSANEGFGLVYLEAGARGKTSIAARAGGAPEVVTSDTGILVPYQDDGAIAEAMVRLDRDRTLAARLGAAALERVRTHFTFGRYAQTLHAALDRAAQGRAGR